MLKKLKEDLYNNRYVVIGLIAYLLFMELVFHELCPVKALFHKSCPGCGLTHALIYLITGRFQDAINANYSIFFWIILAILFFIDRYVKKLNKYIIPVFIAITFIVTFVRYILLFI